MLDSIYYWTFKLILNHIFSLKMLKFSHYVVMEVNI